MFSATELLRQLDQTVAITRNRHILIAAAILALFGCSAWLDTKTDIGFNFRIYQYMSIFRNTHDRYPDVRDDATASISSIYRDYTPLNSVIYRGLFSITTHHHVVFVLYQLTILGVGFLALGRLYEETWLSPVEFLALIAFFVANPLVWRLLSTEDKALFFTLPTVCLLSCARRSATGLAVGTGLLAGWTGIGLTTLPLLAAMRSVNVRTRAAMFIAAATIVIACLASAGMDGIVAIRNREARELLPPFWFSIWRILPGGDSHLIRMSVTAAFMVSITALVWLGRARFVAGFLSATATYLLFSNTSSSNRTLLFLPLFIFVFDSPSGRLVFLLFTMISLGLSEIGTSSVATLQGWHVDLSPGKPLDPAGIGLVLLCNAPVVVGMLRALLLPWCASRRALDVQPNSPIL